MQGFLFGQGFSVTRYVHVCLFVQRSSQGQRQGSPQPSPLSQAPATKLLGTPLFPVPRGPLLDCATSIVIEPAAVSHVQEGWYDRSSPQANQRLE